MDEGSSGFGGEIGCRVAIQPYSVGLLCVMTHQGNEMSREGRLCQHIAPGQLDVHMRQDELDSNFTQRLT